MSYARLGTNCQTNSDVLTSNHKYFPVSYPEYAVYYTKMQRYPATSPETPLDISLDTVVVQKQPVKESYSYKTSCCRR